MHLLPEARDWPPPSDHIPYFVSFNFDGFEFYVIPAFAGMT